MNKNCVQCNRPFEVTKEDQELLKRLNAPEPVFCAACSEQRRMSYRNERHYYKRKCDLTGKDLITIYSPDTPYKVYHREEWFSDKYDPANYGREIDFSRPFFEQLKELSLEVPYEHMVIINSENCDYCNYIVDSKDCYLSQRIAGEGIYYSWLAIARDSFDCHTVMECELCYECIDSFNCYGSKYCQKCKQCTDCWLCYDCTGCTNCFGCYGLRQQEYCFFNEQLSKEEYEEKISMYTSGSYKRLQEAMERFASFSETKPHRYAMIEQCENVSGDYIIKSSNVHRSFDILEIQDASDANGAEYGKDVMRSCFCYYPELTYEFLSCTYSRNIQFSFGVYNSHDIEYSMMVHGGSHNCFGCVGLKNNQYMILNKQYSKEEYEELRLKLIEHMKETGEYGYFFPPELAQCAYNDTVACEYYPLTKEEALAKGWQWRDTEDEIPNVEKIINASELPDSIDDIPDDVLNWAVRCSKTNRPFRILRQELNFYRNAKLPLPRLHLDERYAARVVKRNPKKLWDRTCDKCDVSIQTSYAPERPEKVYCEECYLQEVY